MRYSLAVVVIVLAALLVAAPVASAQTKYVRGTVASVGPDTVTVTVAGKEMTFKVTKDTELTARGAGTAQRKAEQTGAAGVKFVDFVKPGMGVEIHYKDVGGVLTATDIHSGLAPAEGTTGAAAPAGSLRGTVTAVSGTSVTVKDGAKDWVFAVDAKTRVVGQGLGTLNEKLKAEGKAPTVLDLVGVNDKVYVYYQEGANPRANEIRMILKAVK